MKADPETLHSAAPWRLQPPGILDPARAVPTMLAEDERRFYHWVTAEWARGDGAIVDLGCFAGGSTACLAQGHRKAGLSSAIHAYDQFGADEKVKAQFLYPAGIARFEGGDILRLASDLLQPWFDHIELHPGRIEEQVWGGGPIEVLVMDASKSAWTMDRMAETFFPSLIPGASMVIQQDYLYWAQPWIAVQMERMANWFRPVCAARDHTVAFLCTRRIDDDALAAGRTADLSDTEMREALFAARRRLRPLNAAPAIKRLIRAHKANPGVREAHQMRYTA